MAKLRKKHNWKARQVVKTVTDNTETNKISVDLNVKADQYDESNALVLPVKKRLVTKINDVKTQGKRLLSKKQRKKLERVVSLKKRKQSRAEILADLEKLQATEKELQLMTSVTTMQTKGLKRCFSDAKPTTKPIDVSDINSLKGVHKFGVKKAKVSSPNVVGFSDSSSDSEISDDEETVNSNSDGAVMNTDRNVFEDCTVKNEDIPSTDVKLDLVEDKSKNPEKVVVKPTVHIPIRRDAEIQKARLALPILSEEQQIMEAINDNPVIVLSGETGSGKTTQVPQFLYEAGYACDGKLIGVTEPRRIAAVAMSKRVANEMNLDTRNVSYQIRFEGNVNKDTKLKFMTDGVLLKEVQKDFFLSRYKVIIIDEAHERSVYSDILIGLLSRIVPLRFKNGNPLKLIIMSATLRVEDFTQNSHLFKTAPPVIKIESRQYPVTIHFNKRTPTEDYISEAYKKVCKIHQKLPEGGILVFVTGVQEVNSLCRKLRKSFDHLQRHKMKTIAENKDVEGGHSDAELDEKELQISLKKRRRNRNVGDRILPHINLDDYAVDPIDEEQLQEQNAQVAPEDDDDSDVDDDSFTVANLSTQPLYVLPLYSMLPPDQQAKVFQSPPDGSRLCVVATNVAETSLTLPNIRYIVDTGKVKVRMYDKVTGVSAYVVTWTSKASANQRAGRAGRTGPGHCYRLYSSAVFVDEFPNFSEPEIVRRPVDDLVLQMKSMGIDKVVNFPFPTPPSEEALKAAESRLNILGALEDSATVLERNRKSKSYRNLKITPLGQAMACFPISPRYGKMLALSHQHDLLPYMVAIVSALTVQEVFLDWHASQETAGKSNKWTEIKKIWAGQGNCLYLGDVMVLLKAVGASEFNGCTPKFCGVHGLRLKAVKEIRKLRVQLTNEVNLALPGTALSVDPKMSPPTDTQAKLLRQLVLTGMADRVARKVPLSDVPEAERSKKKNAYQCLELDDFVYIHPQSVLCKENCEFVVYQEIVETSKLYMRIVTAVEPEWLAVYAPSQCCFSKPLDDPKPRYDAVQDKLLCHVTATYGKWAWPLPVVEIEFPGGLEKYRWFASFLLEGEVFQSLKKYRPMMLFPPSTVTKSWFKLHQPSEKIILALAEYGITSKEKLVQQWCKNSNYLLTEFRQWLPESAHWELGQKWPPKKS